MGIDDAIVTDDLHRADVDECRTALGSIVAGTTRLLFVVALVVASWALLIASAVLLLGLIN
jgi:hypothetical protein